ncbi:MAG TPA: YtxH domain-containing protein [Sphingomonas sp.]|jgi:hypothetical protein|nr:YtxH domain-containing protein [Sphingomonas sp.]
MPSPSSPAAGGAFIAIGPIIGAAFGLPFGEATLGFLIGLAVGGAVALLIWWRKRG